MPVIHKINPRYDCKWPDDAIAVSLPLESRIEIHNTTYPDLPYEVRIISIKELSEQDKKTKDLFVTVTCENHTKNQSFEIILSCRVISLMTRNDERIIRDTAKVNRDNAYMIVKKVEGYTHEREVQLELLESHGRWATTKILLRELGSYLLNLIARIFRFFTSFLYRQQPQN